MPPDTEQPSLDSRRHWMAVLARASAEQIAEVLGALPAYERVRGPETGLVMVRGRAGGNGAAFNLGEMTVTRCTVKIQNGAIGHAYIAGRDARKAELAAIADALLQFEDALHPKLIEPLQKRQQQARDAIRAKAEATRVQFFALQTMRT